MIVLQFLFRLMAELLFAVLQAFVIIYALLVVVAVVLDFFGLLDDIARWWL